MFAQIPSDFSFPLPNRSHKIFVIFITWCISRNDRNKLSYAIHSIESDIVFDYALSKPNFPSDFPTDPPNHQIIRQWDTGLKKIPVQYETQALDLITLFKRFLNGSLSFGFLSFTGQKIIM